LFPGTVPSPRELGEVLKKHRVDTLWLTAALFNTVISEEPEALSDVKQLLIGGEALSVPHVRRGLALLPNTEIINGYGPTESTTFTCCYRIPRQLDDNLTSIPIGRPIANTEIYILDSHRKPVPIGVAGEIYIGGDGLARGYLNRRELTEEKFVAHPFSGEAGARLYRTGDLARYLPDGNIEFIGRVDNQIKIRGFRIEPGEIEWVLTQHAQIREAIVLAQEDRAGEKRLVGYVVGQPSAPKAEELRNYLKAKLPDYMIPSAFVFIDAFPVTPNGKVDRDALRVLGRGQASTAPSPVVARTRGEAQLAQIWAEVLNVDHFGVHDSFFDLGGHSLLAIRLLARMRQELKIDLPLGRFFEGPTIAHIAEQLESARCEENEGSGDKKWSHLFKLKGGDGGNPVYVFPGGFGGENEALVLAQLAHSVGREYPFYGLRARSSQGTQRGHQTVEEMARDFVREIRELQPRGPYYLLGHCLGGVVAYEVACQIEDQGEQVDMLGFLDTVRPTWLRYFRFRAWRILEKMVPNWKFYYRDRFGYHWLQLARLGWRERANYFTSRLNTVREALDLAPPKSVDYGSHGLSLREMRDNQSGHIVALLRYRARPYRGRIHSLVADEMLSRKKDATLGWKKYVAGGVVVHRGSGDHDSFLRDYTKNVGALVRSWIEESRTEPANKQLALTEQSSALVPEEGLEPSRGLTPPDFESGASAIPPLRRE
jgi:thioesterase domain-containing protein/acyl carrier protein